MRGEDLLDRGGTECADQLVLEIGLAHPEAEPFHVGTVEVEPEAGAFERAPDLALFSEVAEAGQREVGTTRPIKIQESANRVRAPDRLHGNALGPEGAATSHGKRLHRDLVADTFDEDDCTRVLDGGSVPE